MQSRPLVTCALLFLPSAAFGQTWPADSDWTVLLNPAQTGPLTDPTGDQGGGKIVFDIVGNQTDVGGYLYETPTTMYFRVRLADTPQFNTTKWESKDSHLVVLNWGVSAKRTRKYIVVGVS